ncbi:MAG: hypothetical protein ACRECW_00475 [Phyllobacterium sp.]
MFRAWELSPGGYTTLPMRDRTTIRMFFIMTMDHNQRAKGRQSEKRSMKKENFIDYLACFQSTPAGLAR